MLTKLREQRPGEEVPPILVGISGKSGQSLNEVKLPVDLLPDHGDYLTACYESLNWDVFQLCDLQTGVGWPQLLVSTGDPLNLRPSHVFSARDGRTVRHWPHLMQLVTADFNGDRITDYCIIKERNLSVVQGQPEGSWQRLRWWRPVADLNGDGFDDLIPPGFDTAAAVSGKMEKSCFGKRMCPAS